MTTNSSVTNRARRGGICVVMLGVLALLAVRDATAQATGPWFGQLFGAVLEGRAPGTSMAWYLRLNDGTGIRLDASPGQIAALGSVKRTHGSFVRVDGSPEPDASGTLRAILVSSITSTGGANFSSPPAITGNLPSVILNCRYADKPGVVGVSTSFWPALLGTSAPSLNNYYNEVSAGAINFAGSALATGTYLLPGTEASYNPGSPSLLQIIDDCVAAADPTVDFSPYTGVIVQLNGGLSGFAGYAFIGPITVTVDGQPRLMRALAVFGGPGNEGGQAVVAHEIGHTLGLYHSGGTPGSASYPYDSQWDLMSHGQFLFGPASPGQTDAENYWFAGVHLIAYQKNELGWLPPSRVFIPNNGTSTTITLERNALPVGSGYLMAIVPDPTKSGALYTVELRKFAGYDQPPSCVGGTCAPGLGLPGEGVVIVRVDSSLKNGDAYETANIVDKDGNGNVNDSGAIWLGGQQFSGNGGTLVTVNSIGATSAQVTITTGIPALAIASTSPLAGGIVGVAYSQQLSATGGVGGYGWSVNAGSTLPAGLTLSPSGLLSGTPTVAGPFTFTLKVASGAQTATQSFALTVAPAMVISTVSPLPDAVVNNGYGVQLAVTNGSGGLVWSVRTGSTLPAGFALNSAGILSGTGTTAGSASFTVQVVSGAETAIKTFMLTTEATLTITTGTPLLEAPVGHAYSQQLAATGGSPGNTWHLATGSVLPAGLSLSAAGLISGTPTTVGNGSFTVQVASGVQTTSMFFNLAVSATLTITTTSPLPNAGAGQFYDVFLTTSGGVGANAWTVATGNTIPNGLALTSQGLLSGTPTAAATSTFSLQVTNGVQTVVQSFTITVESPIVIGTVATLPGGTVGQPYSQQLVASGGNGSYSWTVETGSTLPAGLSLTTAGVLSGTPTVSAGTGFFIQVTDGNQSAGRLFIISIANSLTIVTTSPLPDAVSGQGYTLQFNAAGSSGVDVWTVLSGSTLPNGLALSSAGVLSGTATAPGPYTFSLQVASGAQTATQSFALTVETPLTISTASPLPSGTVGQSYSQQLAAIGGSGGNVWSAPAGSLPAGLSLTAAGLLSGTPSAASAATITIQVTSGSQTAGKSFTLTIAGPLTITSTSPLPGGVVGQAYAQQLAAAGGSGSYVWTVLAGSTLPNGLALSSAGLLSGTPAAAGPNTFALQVASGAQTVTQSFALTVETPLTISTASPLPGGTVGQAYSQQLAATGGSGGYTWSVPPPSTLPAGLTLSAAGLLSGTPSGASAGTIAIQVNSGSQTASMSFSLTIAGPLTITSTSPLPGGVVGQTYAQQLTAAGGSGSYLWTVASGSTLPSGLTLTAAGVLSGIPSAAATTTFSLQVASGAQTVTQSFTVTIVDVLTISTASPLPGGTVGQAYSEQFAATGGSGGTSSYVWAIAAGSTLPNGLTLTAAGVLSGIPGVAATTTFSLQVTSGALTATRSFALTIASSLTIGTTSPLAGGTVGQMYSLQFAATGGIGSYVWSVPSGSTLPAGLSLTSNGLLSGTPTAPGTTTFVLQVASGGQTAVRSFSLTLTGGLVITTANPLPDGRPGQAYSAQFTATGGDGSYSWALAAGSTLPAGLTITPGGALSGTPTGVGVTTFSIQVTGGGQTIGQTFTLTVIDLVVITTITLADGSIGQQYTAQLTAAGGNGSITWSVASGATLPSWLSLSGDGVLSGRPTVIGAVTLVLQATSVSQGATRTLTINVTMGDIVDRVIADLLGTPTLTAADRTWLDAQGNNNGVADVGDLLALLDRNPGVVLSTDALLRLELLKRRKPIRP